MLASVEEKEKRTARAPRAKSAPPAGQRGVRRVALLIETSNAYARGLLHGVQAFAREHGRWALSLAEQSRGAAPPAWLAAWRGDGIIARIESPEIARAVHTTRLPAVDVSAGRFAPDLPWVETDDDAIARLAAAHLMERGFRRFAYCGDNRFAWSVNRARSFRAITEQAGFPCAESGSKSRSGSSSESKHVAAGTGAGADPALNHAGLVAWLRSLQKPVGVFAGYDILGRAILEACREAGLAVPEEVAVLGMDNDELLCELSTPPLSSVIPDARRAGYEAAATLERMMRGEPADPLARLIPPLGVHARQSTDILATEDAAVARALRFIREHACDPIDVSDVLRVVPLSRRVLEKRFRRELNRTPHQEILQVRLAHVRRLLTETKLPLEEIAVRAGFAHPEYLSVMFKRETGTSPATFRRASVAAGMTEV